MKNELHVLLVENAAPDVALIDHELRRAGLPCQCRRVDSREAFLQEIEHHPPDVILSDHGVPGFDGFTALEEARHRCPETPFIFVTGGLGERAEAETFKRGAEDCVLKSHLHLLPPAIERALKDCRGRRRARQIEEAHRETEEFCYTIALELRTPLRHVEGFAEILLKSAPDRLDHKSRGHLKTISESACQMSRLVDDLFAFSRVGLAEMYRLRISLADMVKEIAHDLSHEVEGRRVEWSIGPLPEVEGDPVLLWLVFTNLLSNALKFTRRQPTARIEIGTRDHPGEHVIFVRDNGVGFDKASAGRLFAVFQRLHGGQFEGTGVGLANVRRVIERHGGRVWAEGEVNLGATFYFSLPRSGL